MRLASIVILLAAGACGSVNPASLDASPGGDAGDAQPAGPLSITVLTEAGDGLPDLTASVLVMTDAGAVIHDGLVDATGKATADLPGRGWVTVRRVSEQSGVREVFMTTMRGVQPGDSLAFGRALRPGPTTGASSMRSFSYTPFSAAVSHTFYTPCSNRFIAAGGATTGQAELFDGCAATTFDFLAIANASPPQFVYLPGQQRGATASITVPLPWTAMIMLTATYTNVPSGMEYFATTRNTLLNGVPVTNAGANIPNPMAGGTLSHQLAYPQMVGSGTRFDIAFGNQTTGERQQLTISTAVPTGSIAFDFATLNLPRLLEVPATTTEGASWTETAVSHQSDARLVVWNGQFSDGALTTRISWQVIDDERAASIVLPALPASYAAYDPRKLPGFTRLPEVYAYYIDCDVITSYDKARPLTTALFLAATDLQPALGPSYRCRRTESPFNQ